MWLQRRTNVREDRKSEPEGTSERTVGDLRQRHLSIQFLNMNVLEKPERQPLDKFSRRAIQCGEHILAAVRFCSPC